MKIKLTAACTAFLLALTGCANSQNSEAPVIETPTLLTTITTAAATETTSASTTATAAATETTSASTTATVAATETTATSTTTTAATTKTTAATTTATAETADTTTVTTAETTESTTASTTITEVTTEETTAAPDPDAYKTITVEGKEYKLTFEDNFDGDKLDERKWERCPEWPRQNLNNQWDNDMSYLDGEGNLIIEMSYDKNQDKYLSGGVRSKGKFEQAYGYFEIRCKVNQIPGYWTAFWLMGECVGDTNLGGVNGTEIDIMESAYYETGEIQNTLNWDGYGEYHKYSGNIAKADVYDGEYHTFSLLWTKEEYIFYIDGEISWRTDAKEARGTCEKPLYIKITSEMGTWANYELLTPDKLPDYMIVDYVRAYSAK